MMPPNFRAMPMQAQGVPQRPPSIQPPMIPGKGTPSGPPSIQPPMVPGGAPQSLRPMKKGGKADSKGSDMKFGEMMAMKSKGRGEAKAGMQKKAAPMKFAKGGSIDGCATKGKTKGKMVTMKRGGKC